MGLDDRLLAAMRRGNDDDDGDGRAPVDVLRRRARLVVRRRRTALTAGLIVVIVTAAAVVVQNGNASRSHPVVVGPQLVQVPANEQLAVSSVSRAAPDPTGVAALVAANSQFAYDLYHELVMKSPNANLVFSPESISHALAMAYAGARGITATQMAKSLHFDGLPQGQLDAAFNALEQELTASRVTQDQGHTPLRLSTSNSEWDQRGFPLEQAYLDTLARYYGAGVHLSDFIHDAERERQRINSYVARQTDNRITELVQPGFINAMTRLVLVDTITFTAAWRSPFAQQLTELAPFTRADGKQVQVPMMSQAEATGFDAYQGDHFVAASLPYEGGASMLLILPDAGEFTTVGQRLDPTLVQQITDGLKPGATVVLPRFDLNTRIDLVNTLRALGLDDLSDFSGIAPPAAGVVVSRIVHQATITVDEKGTRAAAASAAGFGVAGVTGPGLVVRVDRPFIYLIRDDATGAILFVGSVVDPTRP